MDAQTNICTLLRTLETDFPRRKKAIETQMRAYGLHDSVELTMAPPEQARAIPTFDPQFTRPLSPMLQARFDYASAVNYAGELWLSVSEIPRQMKKRALQRYHKSLRNNWEGSAPMLFPDSQLSLFAVTKGVPDHLMYLVWTTEGDEPELWRYAGINSHTFKDLAAFLTWFSTSE
jgi:hypothetical protein